MAESEQPPGPRIPRELILLLLLTPLILTGALTAPFLDFDDIQHVGAPVVLGIKPWYTVFELTSGSIFPLTILSFKLERLIFLNTLGIQNWAPFSRIDNVILHMVAGALVWHIFRALKFSVSWTTLITGAFLFHPMACESVCWVSERKNVLAAAFGLGAIFLSLAYRGQWRTPFILALYVLALLSKPSALGLMPTLLALQLPFVRTAILKTDDALQLSAEPEVRLPPVLMLGVFAAAMGSVAFNLQSHSQMILKPPGGSVFTALLTDAEIFRRYIQNLLVPTQISAAYYVKPIVSLLDPRLLINGGLVAGFIALSIWVSRRRALSAFLWFWFFAGLGPVMNLVATMLLMQDRYVYLSSPALFGIVALALHGILTRAKAGVPELPRVAVIGMLAILLTFAVARSYAWSMTYTLFGDAVEKQPESAFGQMLFGQALIKYADVLEKQGASVKTIDDYRARAVQHLEIACSLDDQERLAQPGKPYLAQAIVQIELGKLDAADALCRRVLEDHLRTPITYPDKIEAHLTLAHIFIKRERYAEALAEAQEALKVGTRNDDIPTSAWLLSGEALEKLHRTDEAVEAYGKIKEWMAEYETAKARLKELNSPHP